MMERRRALDGPLPRRVVRNRRPLELPGRRRLRRVAAAARASRRCRPPWPSPACCATCAATSAFGAAGRADHPRRGPHLRHGRAVPRVQDLRRRRASSTSRSTPTCCCPTPRPRTARSSRRASPRRARWPASPPPAPRYATRGVPMVPFFIFYSMFGFQRVGDLIWAGGRRPGPGLPARRHRRAHHAARRGPPAPGRPQPRAGLDRARRARPTTRPSPTSWRRSSSTASARMYGADAARTSSTTSPSTTRTT